MELHWNYREHLRLAAFVLKWLLIAAPLGIVVGSSVAFFLWALDEATHLQWDNPWLLYGLPLAGALSGCVYHRWGRGSDGGNNLILRAIHEPQTQVPGRMAPLVLGGTLVTHLCGGSAGREGTAVQMGGSLAASWGRWLRLSADDQRYLLMAGMAAGFGAVFGTPLAGAMFALEVLVAGRIEYRALVPCLIASIIGDQTTLACGATHTHYAIEWIAQSQSHTSGVPLDGLLTAQVAIASLAFGLASILFAELTHAVSRLAQHTIARPWLRPVVGGLLVIGLYLLMGQRDYLGLGVGTNPHDPSAVTIPSCFRAGGADWFSWWWKLLFTALTVGSGFKGGEVTPLFFIGAALGHTVGRLLGAPVDLLAGLGFVAVFAGATNTPLASTLMAIELFAPGHGELLQSGFVPYVALACFLSYFLSGRATIYRAQRGHGNSTATTTGSQACSGLSGSAPTDTNASDA